MTERGHHTRLFTVAAGAIAAASIVGLGACATEAEEGVIDSQELVGEAEDVGTAESAAISGSYTVGTVLKTTSDLNLRTGADTTYAVVTVMPSGSAVKLLQSSPSNTKWYKVSFNGLSGWTSGDYLNVVSSEGDRELAITRAAASTGFSYWWGHGRFRPEGPTSSIAGSCSGSCPSCTHSGSYGGDCSGLVAKVWQVPSTNTDLTVDSHPYGTVHFNVDSSQWTTIARGNMLKADAMVYNIDGAGHIFVYSSGDPWGSMNAYECKGCSSGCVYNLRTATSSYHAIRRVGY